MRAEPGSGGDPSDTDASSDSQRPTPGERLIELVRAGPRIDRTAWGDALASAAFGYLALLCVGAVFMVAAKLQFPALGSGFNPLSIVTAMTVLGLASLGAPLHIGAVELSALPLGSLGLFGAAFAAAVRLPRATRLASAPLSLRVVAGVRCGVCFGALCGLAALIFRFRGAPDPVSVTAWGALGLGLLWGCLFGLLGSLRAQRSVGSWLTDAARALRVKSRLVYEAAAGAGFMLVAGLALSGGAAVVWIVVALARGSVPPGFGIRDAVAAILYLVAFAPNIAVSFLALSLGAPVEVGGRVTVGGRDFGQVLEYSFVQWGAGDPPWYLFALLLIPALSCFGAGFVARRTATDDNAVLEVIGLAALLFAGAVLVLASVGDARLGAGLLGRRGLARAAPDALTAAVFACGWGAALGFMGWKSAGLVTRKSGLASRKAKP